MVQKLSSMEFVRIYSTRQVNLVPKMSKSGRGKPCLQSNNFVSVPNQVITSCISIWRLICHFLKETNVMRGLKMHKVEELSYWCLEERLARRTQAPTLIIVRDGNSECFVDRAEQEWIKPMLLGSLCFWSKTKYFSLSCREFYSQLTSVVLVTHMQTRAHRHVWCDIPRKWTDECIGADHLHLLIMGPGKITCPLQVITSSLA